MSAGRFVAVATLATFIALADVAQASEPSPRFASSLSYSENSSGLARLAPRTRTHLPLSEALTLEFGAGFDRVASKPLASHVSFGVAGLGVAAPIGDALFRGHVAGYFSPRYRAWDASAEVGAKLHRNLRVLLRVRHRPLSETAAPFATDEETFYLAGLGGAQTLWAVLDLSAAEVLTALSASPCSFCEVHASARGLRMSDGNQGVVASAGVGLDLLAPLEIEPARLFAIWDLNVTGFLRSEDAYHSPPFEDAHRLGLLARADAGSFQLSATGGVVASSHTEQALLGWFGGVGLAMTRGYLTAQLRIDRQDTPGFQAWRSWLSVELRP